MIPDVELMRDNSTAEIENENNRCQRDVSRRLAGTCCWLPIKCIIDSSLSYCFRDAAPYDYLSPWYICLLSHCPYLGAPSDFTATS
jgi:hypothetical protein